MKTEPDRCNGCGKVLLNYPEPYLGDPAEIERQVAAGHLPAMHVRAQRETLIRCSECRILDQIEDEKFRRVAQEAFKRDHTRSSFSMCSSGPSYKNRRDEWEDLETGAKGKL